ncbi:MAG: ATP-dependent DNA helicase RecG [Candidatus Pacebacteria bacterium]|nr:ATP-dependent DNA helicase RecG [Candidatus Paceibacterota bacterium]
MELDSLIEKEFRLIEPQKVALKKLGLKTIEDLLFQFPVRYGDTSQKRNIGNLIAGDKAVIFGKISNLKTSKGFKSKIPMSEAWIEDESGKIKAVWFHQPYIAKMISEGMFVRADGKVSDRKGELYMSNPKIETVSKLPIGVGDSLFGEDGEVHSLYPVYPESKGITSNWFYHSIKKIFTSGILDSILDTIPEYILTTYNLPPLKSALIWIHEPQKQDHALMARKRFAFEEVFFIQIERIKTRIEWQKEPAFTIKTQEANIDGFVKRFPFTATEGQTKAIREIFQDFTRGHPMSRLLEGDVGSGKTAVAATAAFGVVTTRPQGQNFGTLQVAYMAPTEILAKQHFESFIKYFTYLGINVGLITGSGCKKFPSKVNPSGWTDISRTQLLKWVENGEIPILIGTHSLIQKTVKFKHLAFVVIDEQHRFGMAQRQKLVKKEKIAPHLLSMTATPIPRTLALTIYGDLDLTLLDQMPTGRKPIITEIVLPGKREDVYEKIREQMKEGRQLYIICPRIDEPDPNKEASVQAKSVKEEAKRIKEKIFPEYEIDILHSKMTPKEKEGVMADFSSGKIRILVATSVVEVGVNVPNATVIIIEGAERFGLAQLHQLRGRVVRSNHQAYCYVFAETKSEKTIDRLRALTQAKNGFELAEYDLKLRGAGGLSEGKQWGISDIGMEAIKNIKMVEAARAEAGYLLEQDETLSKFPLIVDKLCNRKKCEIHFE